MRFNTVLCDTDEFKFTGEVIEGNFYLHCDVKKNTHNVIKHIRAAFELVKQYVYLEGWDFIFTYTENGRWVKLFNGKYVSSVKSGDREIEVYVWELK
ncbi:MAG: hypothetical protein ACRCVU_14040 [Flavobacterium sp.]